MTTQTKEPSKPKSMYVDEAIQLAVDGRWEEAVELNQFLLDTFGPDEAAYNRLGKALTELGRLAEAKRAYEATLALNPLNLVARKNADKLDGLMSAKEALKAGGSRVDLNLFVEEMGKTTTTTLREVVEDVSSKVAAGDVAELRVVGDGIEVDTQRGVRVGTLEPKLARRLIKFIQGGNRYQAGITAVEGDTVRVIVREVYQDPRFAGKPSFPIVRRRELDFRPYSRESLVARAPYEVEEEEEEEGAAVARTASLDLDEDEEGMHEVALDDEVELEELPEEVRLDDEDEDEDA